MTSTVSDKSRSVALILAAVLGVFGAHRFYAGRIKSGVLMLVTLGGLGIWYLYDLILVGTGGFRDAEGRLILEWDLEAQVQPELSDEVLQELAHLRQEVAELTERVDFTERLLADQRRDALDNPERTR